MNGVVVSGCLWVIRWPHFRHLSRVRIICGALYSGTRACYTWGKVSHGQRVVAPVLRAWCACHPLCHSRTATTAFIYLFCVFCSRLAVHKCERFTNFLDQFFLQAIEFSNTGCNCKSVALQPNVLCWDISKLGNSKNNFLKECLIESRGKIETVQ